MGYLPNPGRVLFSPYRKGPHSFRSQWLQWIVSPRGQVRWGRSIHRLSKENRSPEKGPPKEGRTAVFQQVRYPIENPAEENVLN